MPNPGIKDPTVPVSSKILKALGGKPMGGLIGAAISSSIVMRRMRAGKLPIVADNQLYAILGSAVVGFGMGAGTSGMLQWCRWQILKMLLAYNGWMFKQTAFSTKVWAIMLKLMVGPGPHKTFEFQKVMPKLPIPELKDSCERYLVLLKPLLKEEEYEEAEQYMKELLEGDGPKLQQYLLDRKKKLRSWLADWWLTKAYLARRDPIAINVNFFMCSTFLPEYSKVPLARTANAISLCRGYYEMILNNTLPPDLIMGVMPVCMDGVRYLMGTCRVPGEQVDRIEHYSDTKHVVIISKGIYYKLEIYAPDKYGKMTPLTLAELMRQINYIADETADIAVKDINKVAALTTQNRTVWAQHRKLLQSNPVNAATLQTVESALFMSVIGHDTPQNISQQTKLALTGDGTTRWFDKSLTVESFRDSSAGCTNMEHSGADATHFAVMWEHNLQLERYGPDGNVPEDPPNYYRDLPLPKRLEWQLDYMQEHINKAYAEYQGQVEDMDSIVITTPYGKKWLKTNKVSPDGFLQMAIQLAYWRTHNEFTKTYEPSSSRLFLLGRTDNINPLCNEAIVWVHGMEDPKLPREDKIKRLRAAIKQVSARRLMATAGYGCERHLLGLSIAAREMGMDIPALFRSNYWDIPMKLSTSQVPTVLGTLGLPIEPESIIGGFSPSATEGYGILYVSINDHMFNFNVTAWKSHQSTCSLKFANAVTTALNDMRDLMEGKTSNGPGAVIGKL